MDILERFMSNVQKTESCWKWIGGKTSFGHGNFFFDGKSYMAHRLAYTLFNGEIPKGMVIMHKCDNPECTNPEHLKLGTQADNLADMRAKKRHKFGESHPKTTLTEQQVREIKSTPLKYGSGILLAKKFNITPQAVSMIRSGRNWAHLCA